MVRINQNITAIKNCLFARILCCNTFFDAHVLHIHSAPQKASRRVFAQIFYFLDEYFLNIGFKLNYGITKKVYQKFQL